MSFDAVLLIILIVAGVCFFRKFSSSVYFIASLDIFFRILTFVRDHIGVKEISEFIRAYFPESIPSVIYRYTDGVLSTVLMWVCSFICCILILYG